jgi:hypothetical protein
VSAARRRRGQEQPEDAAERDIEQVASAAGDLPKGPRRRRSKGTPALSGDDTTPSGAQKRTTPSAQPTVDPKAGYRSTKRTSKGGKQLRKQAEVERVRVEVSERTDAVARVLKRVATVGGTSVLSLVLVIALLWGGAIGVNALARWNARRLAAADAARTRSEMAKENLLVIGVKDKEATGFVALKAERAGNRVLGINIPDGAFVEVPGQGYESIGDSYHGGPEISKDAVSNFLMVPFERYVTIDADVFQQMVTGQDVKDLIPRALATDLTSAEKEDLAAFFGKVPTKDVWIVPMPVKPIAVGSERYFEPQRAEIADLVLQWWDVRFESQKQAPRVALYNGVGTPGVAGKAAQQLIRRGFRVVDSKNADNFDYMKTRILLYHGTRADAEAVKEALGGTGEIVVESAAQNVADIIVIVGADYVPPATP